MKAKRISKSFYLAAGASYVCPEYSPLNFTRIVLAYFDFVMSS